MSWDKIRAPIPQTNESNIPWVGDLFPDGHNYIRPTDRIAIILGLLFLAFHSLGFNLIRMHFQLRPAIKDKMLVTI